MSQLSSKLANSVRQAKAQQKDDQPASEAQTEDSTLTGEASAQSEPKAAPARQAGISRNVAEEPPLPKMPSRRVWPD